MLSRMGNFLNRQGPEVVVRIRTGDRRYAGKDFKVDLTLVDEQGNKSDVITLDNFILNNSELGKEDTFTIDAEKVSSLPKSADITLIELRREESWLTGDWYLEKLTVENKSNKKEYVFPVLRWIRNGQTYLIRQYDTCLPQNEIYGHQRYLQLKEKRAEYEIAQKIPKGPIQVKELPRDEDFSFKYKWDLAYLKVRMEATFNTPKMYGAYFSDVEEMSSLYDGSVYCKPGNTDRWNDDVYFGWQRLVRVNPTAIRLVTEVPSKLPVNDYMMRPLLEGFIVQDVIELKRLFIIDYAILEGLPHKDGYVMCAPIALFYYNSTGQFVPVAIQLFQTPGSNNPIFTPNDPPMAWTLAKMWFNNADAACHQSITHLGYTHLIVEGFALASHRHLAVSHPMFKLLAPHFLYIFAINGQALSSLLEVGGWVDLTMNCGKLGMEELVRRGLDGWRLDVEGTLPEDLKNRGLDDLSVLPCYYYRDDGLLLYNAIVKYVTSYVHLYYPDTEVLKNDREIQSWARTLVTPRKGSHGGIGIQGLPGNGELTTHSQLIQILSSIIFVSSAGHAAANFPQYDEYAYPPKYPALMKGTPPTDKNVQITEDEFQKHMTNQLEMLSTMSITQILTLRGTNNLGNFEVEFIYEPEARKLVDAFREDLLHVGEVIKQRNEVRDEPYIFLDPSLVPNSVSI